MMKRLKKEKKMVMEKPFTCDPLHLKYRSSFSCLKKVNSWTHFKYSNILCMRLCVRLFSFFFFCWFLRKTIFTGWIYVCDLKDIFIFTGEWFTNRFKCKLCLNVESKKKAQTTSTATIFFEYEQKASSRIDKKKQNRIECDDLKSTQVGNRFLRLFTLLLCSLYLFPKEKFCVFVRERVSLFYE